MYKNRLQNSPEEPPSLNLGNVHIILWQISQLLEMQLLKIANAIFELNIGI